MAWDRRRQFWAATSVRLGELAHSGRAPADIATLEELHALHAPRTWSEGSRCAECAQRWPCAVYRGIAARVGTDVPGRLGGGASAGAGPAAGRPLRGHGPAPRLFPGGGPEGNGLDGPHPRGPHARGL